MKTHPAIRKTDQTGSALMLVMIMSTVALLIVAGVMRWSASSARLTHRSIQYTRSTAAAEAATEKVITYITQDFLSGGESLVINNLNTYRTKVPMPSDSSYWNTWVFDDGNGNLNQTFVQTPTATNYLVLNSTYAGLQGYVSTFSVVSHARDTASIQDVNAGVLQQLQLVGIPIFQFYLFSSGNMEISCGQPFVGTGRVFSDGHLYIEPDASMMFESSVSAVLDVITNRDTADGDTRPAPAGLPAIYTLTQPKQPVFPVPALTLPIGAANTPTAIREIIEPTPPGENPSLPISKLRYNNRCDMVLTVSNSGVSATSGAFNNFATPIPTNDLASFVFTTNSFWDGRESKTVQPIDIDIGKFTTWSQTSSNVLIAPLGRIPNSIYVVDDRTPPVLPAGNLGAVRVFDGLTLPPKGLTVATGLPLYVWGDYNDYDSSKLGTSDTSATYPASLVADAITFLSDAWLDQNQQTASLNGAASTTVNAALLTGVVETTQGQYSGGMENFPRFLESWGLSNTNTYNGSMMKMFPSLYATNVWEGIGYANHYYDPPARNWTYDTNFDDPTKLPPLTPQFQSVKRQQWVTVAPNVNVAPATP